MRAMRFAVPILVASTAALAGCVAAPHYVRSHPQIDGVLASAGVPRAGVTVGTCLDEPPYPSWTPDKCEHRLSTTTDEQGRFHFEGAGKLHLLLFGAGDVPFDLLTVKDGDRELSWHRFDPSPPMRTQMACELGERLVCTARDLR